MEFKSLKNIESSFSRIRIIVILFLSFSLILSVYAIYKSFRYAEEQRQKIYVLDQGKSLILALSQDLSQNRPVEAREHIKRFHELFFTLSPDKVAIETNLKRALNLADKSAFQYYKDLLEKGYYNRVISSNINQIIMVDSVICHFEEYPYQAQTFARQIIMRESNVTERSLISKCRLLNSSRSDNNPHGFTIEKFEVMENRDINVWDR